MSTESHIEARDAKTAGGVVAEGRETLRALAAKMGLRVSERWNATPKQQAAYAAEHADRRGWADETDVQIACRVRMLMRDDLDHEAVVTVARDRICALVTELTAAQAREAGLREALDAATADVEDLRNQRAMADAGREGWVLVPREPTPPMLFALTLAVEFDPDGAVTYDAAKAYTAIIAAAPTPEAPTMTDTAQDGGRQSTASLENSHA